MTSNEEEKHVKRIKRELEGWREVVLPINSVLLWDKQWYPGMILGLNTVLFITFWYLDPSVVSTLSMLGLLGIILDSLVPALTTSLCQPDTWTGTKEKHLEEICRKISLYLVHLNNMWTSLSLFKTRRPSLYFTVVTFSLLFLSWLGNTINNLLLMYIFSTVLLLCPGLIHHGIIDKYSTCICTHIDEILQKTKLKIGYKTE